MATVNVEKTINRYLGKDTAPQPGSKGERFLRLLKRTPAQAKVLIAKGLASRQLPERPQVVINRSTPTAGSASQSNSPTEITHDPAVNKQRAFRHEIQAARMRDALAARATKEVVEQPDDTTDEEMSDNVVPLPNPIMTASGLAKRKPGATAGEIPINEPEEPTPLKLIISPAEESDDTAPRHRGEPLADEIAQPGVQLTARHRDGIRRADEQVEEPITTYPSGPKHREPGVHRGNQQDVSNYAAEGRHRADVAEPVMAQPEFVLPPLDADLAGYNHTADSR